MSSIMKFETDATRLVSDALQQEVGSGNPCEVVMALARVLRYAIDVATCGHEDDGAEVRDAASDTLYGASSSCDFVLSAFGDVPVVDFDDYQKGTKH